MCRTGSLLRRPSPSQSAISRAIPERAGEPSPISHIVFIIKENRTYDQVFGDISRGNGDKSLVMFGEAVTPNQHRLAEQFVLLDNFYATGGNSADGHQWLTQANETAYALLPGYEGRSYPFDGSDPLGAGAVRILVGSGAFPRKDRARVWRVCRHHGQLEAAQAIGVGRPLEKR